MSTKFKGELDGAMERLDTMLGGLSEEQESIGKMIKAEQDKSLMICVPLKSIHPDPDQPRRHFKESDLVILMESIMTEGLIKPLTLRETNDGYMIIDGERRYRALSRAQNDGISSDKVDFTSIPCYVLRGNQEGLDLAVKQYMANEAGVKLNVVEKARWIHQQMKQHDVTVRQLAERIGEGKSTVANYFNIGEWLVDHGVVECLLPYGDGASLRVLMKLVKYAKSHGERNVAEDIREFCKGDGNAEDLKKWVNSYCSDAQKAEKETGKIGSVKWSAQTKGDTMVIQLSGITNGDWQAIQIFMQGRLQKE